MKFSTLINRTSPFPFGGLLADVFHFHSNYSSSLCQQTGETRYAASYRGKLCFPLSLKKDAILIWVKGYVAVAALYVFVSHSRLH